MHELGVVFHIIKDLEDVAAENRLQHINKVTLELGEVSTVIPFYLKDCWEWASERTDLIRDCDLEIITIPARTRCGDCGALYETVAHGRICPACGSEKTWLEQGNEFIIRSVEATDE